MIKFKCDCGHYLTSHYDYVRDNRYGCKYVCSCGKEQGELRREREQFLKHVQRVADNNF